MKRNRKAVQEARNNRHEEDGRVVRGKFQKEIKDPIQPLNNKQREYLQALANYNVVVFYGSAGTGKSFLTMSECTDWLKRGIYDKLVLSRPSVGMGNSLGLLPGTLRDKFEPYLIPMVDVICERYGRGFYENSLSNGMISFAPLEYLRGRSFDGIIVVDEAQNTTPDDMYTILTRLSEGGKLIIIGDPTQNDLKGENGIDWLVKFISSNPELKHEIAIVNATSDDIVRSGLCKKVVKARERSLQK